MLIRKSIKLYMKDMVNLTCWETRDCRNTAALTKTLIHLAPPICSGRYTDTLEP